jgi:BMFP domain-containing protein YqiC
MSKKSLIEELAKQLTEMLPSHLIAMKKDFEKNCSSIITKTLSKFDLILREEFNAQSRVLVRTRKKVEALEEQVKQLEKAIKQKNH